MPPAVASHVGLVALRGEPSRRAEQVSEATNHSFGYAHIAISTGNGKATVLAETLDRAIGDYLDNERFPSRKVNEIDNRGCSFYLTLYWAQALAAQDGDPELKARFQEVARALTERETQIAGELLAAQGRPMDIGGYYHPDAELAAKAMRPSATFNAVIDGM